MCFINLETSVLSGFSYGEQTDPDAGWELWENPSWAGPVAPFPQKENSMRKAFFSWVAEAINNSKSILLKARNTLLVSVDDHYGNFV